MKIFVVRHGESTGDIEDRYGGDYDDPLTEKGLEGARECAREFLDKGIQVIFSSPRSRALQAAEAMAKILNAEIKVLDDLREWNRYGVLTGMVKAEAKEKFPQEVSLVGEFEHNKVSGSESYDELKRRVAAVFGEISNAPCDSVMVVSHGGVIKCFAKECLETLVARYYDYGYFEVESEAGKHRFIRKVRYDIEGEG